MTLSESLKQLRREKNVLQKELAVYLRCSPGTVSNYENGVHEPDLETLCRMADFFEVTVDFLLGRREAMHPRLLLERPIKGSYTVGDFVRLTEKLPEPAKAHLVYELRLYGRSCGQDDPSKGL